MLIALFHYLLIFDFGTKKLEKKIKMYMYTSGVVVFFFFFFGFYKSCC